MCSPAQRENNTLGVAELSWMPAGTGPLFPQISVLKTVGCASEIVMHSRSLRTPEITCNSTVLNGGAAVITIENAATATPGRITDNDTISDQRVNRASEHINARSVRTGISCKNTISNHRRMQCTAQALLLRKQSHLHPGYSAQSPNPVRVTIPDDKAIEPGRIVIEYRNKGVDRCYPKQYEAVPPDVTGKDRLVRARVPLPRALPLLPAKPP